MICEPGESLAPSSSDIFQIATSFGIAKVLHEIDILTNIQMIQLRNYDN